MLCARANDDVNDELSASEDNDLKVRKDHPRESTHDDALESDTIKYCIKGEPVSCYCSASHTDNISTDEHDSLRDSHTSNLQQTPKSLQLSDSGADLTADVGCNNSAWQKYWQLNGEQLIWKSWIAKYSAYINPEYLQAHQGEANYPKDLSSEDLLIQDKAEGSSSLKFSFDSLSPHQDDYGTALGHSISLLQVKENTDSKSPSEVLEKNRMLIRNLSYSDSYDKLNREIEGWNPLSPVSNDCETEAERLLSSRCASRTGSYARTVDSMTNVTRLTVSSFDLTESSKNSDSFSSVSSIQSSITSTSSEDADEPADYEHQWNVLWTNHYEKEYLDHYKKFLLDSIDETVENTDEAEEFVNKDDVEDNFKSVETPNAAVNLGEETSESSNKDNLSVISESRKRKVRNRLSDRKVIDSVGYALKHLIKTEKNLVQEEHIFSSYEGETVTDLATNSPTLDGPVNSEIDLKPKMDTGSSSKFSNVPAGSETVDWETNADVEGQVEISNNADVECGLQQNISEMKETNDDLKSDVEIDLPSNYSNIRDIAESQTVDEHKGVELENVPSSSKMREETIDNNILETETNLCENALTNTKVEYTNSGEEEAAAMSAMGIPLSFVHKKQLLKNSSVNTRKRSLEEDDLDQSSSNRIKAAFTLLGIEMNVGQERKFRGSIEYKMKHIRSQNRRLQFRNEDRSQTVTPGPKHIHFDDDGDVISDISASNEVTVQNSHQDELLGMIPSSSEHELDIIPDEEQKQEVEKREEGISKKRKRKRKINIPLEIRENPNLKKFWHRRYSLFSKFDQGIKLDEESWFSVTPEMVAQHTAKRCQCDVIIDAFCGAGGNSIQFAFTCRKVIAVDIDAKKIELAQNNAQVYGVADRIEFIVGDFFQLADTLKADMVFLSPPWGGPQYRNFSSYNLEWLQPAPFNELLSTARKITENIALFLPKNCNTYPLVTAAGPGGKMEIEQNFLGKRLIAITAYYGKLVNDVPLQKNTKDLN